MLRLPKPVGKFYADRGPHLAAMIAYFALLSFVPLLFLTISALSLAGRPDESSYLVTELKRAFPGSSISSIVHTVREIQKHATALGIIGGAALLWASLSLFSALESAFNIVYGKPNRSFLRGKLLAVGLMLLSLVTLFIGLLIGSFGYDPVFIPDGEEQTVAELGNEWKSRNSHRAKAASALRAASR
jgi:membrane protein